MSITSGPAPNPQSPNTNTTIWLIVAIVLALAALLITFMHHFPGGGMQQAHGCGCCCCNGGGVGMNSGAGGNNAFATGGIHNGNPGTTIVTLAPSMTGLPIPSGSSTSYDGLIHIKLDPTVANPPGAPITFIVSYTTTTGPALIMKKDGALVQPVQVNSSRTITYPGNTPTEYTIEWPSGTPPGPGTLVTNYPPTGYNPGTSDFSGTYSFDGGIGNITIH